MGNKNQDPRFADLSNLVNIKLDTNNKVTSNDGKVLRISVANAQFIRNKDLLFHDHICDNRIDVCPITEIWLHYTVRDRAWLCSASVNSDPLNILTSNRRNRTGGDLAIMYRKLLKVREVEEGTTNTFQYVIWKVLSGIYYSIQESGSCSGSMVVDKQLNKSALNKICW